MVDTVNLLTCQTTGPCCKLFIILLGCLQKYVAVKSLKNIHIDGVLSAMLKEAAIMQKLQNPHIVTLFGISLPEGEEPLKLASSCTLAVNLWLAGHAL